MKVFYKPYLMVGEISIEDSSVGEPLYKIVFDNGNSVCTYRSSDSDFVSQ